MAADDARLAEEAGEVLAIGAAQLDGEDTLVHRQGNRIVVVRLAAEFELSSRTEDAPPADRLAFGVDRTGGGAARRDEMDEDFDQDGGGARGADGQEARADAVDVVAGVAQRVTDVRPPAENPVVGRDGAGVAPAGRYLRVGDPGAIGPLLALLPADRDGHGAGRCGAHGMVGDPWHVGTLHRPVVDGEGRSERTFSPAVERTLLVDGAGEAGARGHA